MILGPLNPKVHGSRCWWPILKAGSTTLNAWLPCVHPCDDPSLDMMNPRPFEHFAVTRDVVQRYISGLHQMWCGNPHPIDLIRQRRLEGWLIDRPDRIGFAEFVAQTERWSDTHGELWTCGGNPHFHDQHSVARLIPDGQPLRTFRLERLDELADWLELDEPPHLNRGGYDDDVVGLIDVDRVRRRYACDIRWADGTGR